MSFWNDALLSDRQLFEDAITLLPRVEGFANCFAEAAMRFDFDSYLISDNLFKVDRAAMANSLEVRLPILDPAVIEYSRSLPMDLKIREGIGKWVLREVLYKHVPRALIERPKMGFSVPLARWLREDLHAWADGVRRGGEAVRWGLDADILTQAWGAHCSGVRDCANALWVVAMFVLWARQYERFIAET